MNNTLFSISKLSCSYTLDKDDKALYIEKLDIPDGKLIFLLGASGCGKSTLLETLGLMNNTIADGEILLNTKEDKPIEVSNLWKPENYSLLTDVRKNNYSFIFQNTNLMENFTAYENVCLSGMIKQDVPQNEVLENARVLMEKVKLPDNEVNLNTLSVNLSGGQRQRIAFVRALNNNATILFGDEPTGNLDEANANELFEIVKSELNKGLSAIIVSHDIDLAVKYADQIVVITKDKNKSFGEVHPENIFNSDSWKGASNERIDQFKDKLRSYYNTGNERITDHEKKTDTTVADTSLRYKKLFLLKEGKVLFGGKSYLNFIILSTILFFTFLAIGFGNGCLDYLKLKMSNAFVNWITISIPADRGRDKGAMTDIINKLNEPENKKSFSYNDVTPYVTSSLYVWDKKINSFLVAEGRSIDCIEDDKFMKDFILSSENYLLGKKNGFKNKYDLGLIVTQDFLKESGYPENANIIYCQKTLTDTITHLQRSNMIPIQVVTIVKSLPGKCKVIYTNRFSATFLNFGDDKAFDISTKKNNVLVFSKEENKEKANDIKKNIEKCLTENSAFYNEYRPLIRQSIDTLGFVSGNTYEVYFESPLVSSSSTDSLYKALIKYLSKKTDTTLLGRTYVYDPYDGSTKALYDEISVYFNDLHHIRDFSNYLKNEYNKGERAKIEVDISKVTEKENFDFLSTVTGTISVLLVVFSVLAVCLFIFNLLRSHLSKVKMNIGTFKAIGLQDSTARNIYIEIIFYFIVFSCTVGLVLASIVGYVGNRILVQSLTIQQDVSYFKIVHINTLLTLIFILFSAFFISRYTIKKILNKTPGNLIYNR